MKKYLAKGMKGMLKAAGYGSGGSKPSAAKEEEQKQEQLPLEQPK